MSCSKRHIVLLFLLLLTAQYLLANRQDSIRLEGHKKVLVQPDTIYKGLFLKWDVANALIEPFAHAGKRQSYEMSVSVDLKHRLYPTAEIGFATAHQTATDSLGVSTRQSSTGAFGRVGLDVAMVKAKDESLAANNLLLGVRLGMGGPQCDVWGEVHFGAQVEICKRFLMGWSIRERILFTKKNDCFYIPGYGNRKDSRLGFEYYLGIRI